MSKYTNPSSLMDAILEAAVGLLMLMVIFWLIVWLLSRVILWVLGGALLALGIWLIVRWLRWRRERWY